MADFVPTVCSIFAVVAVVINYDSILLFFLSLKSIPIPQVNLNFHMGCGQTRCINTHTTANRELRVRDFYPYLPPVLCELTYEYVHQWKIGDTVWVYLKFWRKWYEASVFRIDVDEKLVGVRIYGSYPFRIGYYHFDSEYLKLSKRPTRAADK